MDFAQFSQQYGALILQLIGLVLAFVTYLRKSKIVAFLAPRFELVRRAEAAEALAESSQREARSAEATNRNQQESIAALQVQQKALQDQVDELRSQNNEKMTRLKEIVDAWYDYGKLLVNHILSLHDDMKMLGHPATTPMPPVPEVLADRFDIPETLR